jgi:Dihaem cytochrome c
MRTMSAVLIGAATVMALAVFAENEVSVPSMTAQAAVVSAAATPSPTPTRSGEAAFNEECGACHFAFPPQFLPVRSWRAIMAGLDSHFGENASLDPDTATQITDYLVANAAGPGSPVLRGLDPQETPLRITETRLWNRIHHEIRASVYDRPDIKSKSNCLACHGGGARVGDD